MRGTVETESGEERKMRAVWKEASLAEDRAGDSCSGSVLSETASGCSVTSLGSRVSLPDATGSVKLSVVSTICSVAG